MVEEYKELCPNVACGKSLSRYELYCESCEEPLKWRIHERKIRKEQAKKEHITRQEADFYELFDKRSFELAMEALTKAKQLTVSELVDIMIEKEGFFEKFAAKIKVSMPNDRKELKFKHWARFRVIGLAKWWRANQVAFIGTDTIQGHPYRFYLGEKPNAIFDPTMKGKAQWSVNKVAKVIETESVIS